jgi:hypothetical protein
LKPVNKGPAGSCARNRAPAGFFWDQENNSYTPARSQKK